VLHVGDFGVWPDANRIDERVQTGDTIWERSKTLAVVLASPRRALLGNGRAEVVITNDDPPSVATMDDVEVAEGHFGVNPVAMTLRFDRPAPPDVKVHVNVVAGSARPGEDFRPSSRCCT
jgi:hypothetical protein